LQGGHAEGQSGQKEDLLRQTKQASDFLAAFFPVAPEIVIQLGTGLGGQISARLQETREIAYPEIPHFPLSTVAGHQGKLIAATCHGRQLAILQGRSHFYEGYSALRLTFPLRVLNRMGAKFLAVCNTAGGLNPAFSPGSLMLIRDHLNFIPDNPLRGANIDEWGPRFPDMSSAYDLELMDLAKSTARKLGEEKLCEGVYVAIPGPSLETLAETVFLRQCGADAVGMSTVPEVILARHAGMRVLGISVIANVNDPARMVPIVLDDVLVRARIASASLESLLLATLKAWPRA